MSKHIIIGKEIFDNKFFFFFFFFFFGGEGGLVVLCAYRENCSV